MTLEFLFYSILLIILFKPTIKAIIYLFNTTKKGTKQIIENIKTKKADKEFNELLTFEELLEDDEEGGEDEKNDN